MNPSQHKMTVFSQIFKLLPRNLIPKLAKKHGVDKKSRSFSPTSHVLCLVFGQLSHAIGLNDICDTLHNHSGVLTTIRMVEINGKMKKMTFITNNFVWSANSICDLYKARWAIEVFFKKIKQTLKLADFVGYNENAIRWQIWTALLTYILLRFIAWQSKWSHSFMRLFTVLRGVLWSCLDMSSVLECCGTAGRTVRMRTAPELAYLPGLAPGG